MLVTSNCSLGSVTPIVVTVGTFGSSTARNASPAGGAAIMAPGQFKALPVSDRSILSIVAPEHGGCPSAQLIPAPPQTGPSSARLKQECSLSLLTCQDFLPADIQTQFTVSRELIRNIYNSFYKLRDRAERIASRAIDNAADLLIFGKELSALGSDTTPLPSWAPLSSSTWASLKQALKGLSVEFALLADRAAQQGKQEENNVVEKLNLFLDLLQSYKDLCERHEKGVLHRHQRALHKYSLMKRQMMRAAVQSCEPEAVEQLETCIVEQENAIQTMELQNCFSLYCLHQEMQLVHAYLPLTSHILGAFVNSQIQGHKEMSKVWNDLRSKLPCFFAGQNSNATPPRFLQDGVSPH
ncbi:sorting nexin-8-like [Manis pentadactyla]|uniref:sorting nexin-8-like n=1 Tax=Manis pentadactyla TaxID=143292 RepID=UPI00255C3223|nr:sorting nexin-8-like [Manis pentadactyla]